MTRSKRSRIAETKRHRWPSLTALALTAALIGCAGDDGEAPSVESEDSPSEGVKDEPRDGGGGRGRDAGRATMAADGSAGGSAAKDAGKPIADAGRTVEGVGKDAGVTATPAVDAGSAPPSGGDVCARWKTERASLSEGTWTGNAEACEAGDMSEEARGNALRSLNLYRSLAGLAPVAISAEGNRLAQQCALLMRANGTITHTPPETWKCYTAEAAKTAGASSLSSEPGVVSVDSYMLDPGNPTTIGHRRWILSNWLTGVGFGSADRFSCQYQPARQTSGGAGKPWVAWPSAGQIPLQALQKERRGSVDMTGWTVQSDSIDLKSAQVSVTSGGMDRPVVVTQLLPGYGSRFALRFNPSGWTTQAGQTYSVKVTGTSMPIEYEVEVVDCPR
jgi:hypothetical protein